MCTSTCSNIEITPIKSTRIKTEKSIFGEIREIRWDKENMVLTKY